MKFFTQIKNNPIMKDGDNNCNYIDTSESDKKQSSIKNNKKFSDDNSDNEKKSDNESDISESKSSNFNSYDDELEVEKRIFRKRKKRIKKMKK